MEMRAGTANGDSQVVIEPRGEPSGLAVVGLQPFKNLAALSIQNAQANRPRRPRHGNRLADYV